MAGGRPGRRPGLAGCRLRLKRRLVYSSAGGVRCVTAQHDGSRDADPPTTPATPSAPGSSAPRASALDQLTGLIAGAERMDGALRNTAAMVNRGIGPETINVSADAYAAITAIDPGSLVASLPGGMPDRLRWQALLVFSDLAARRHAYQHLLLIRGNLPVSRISSDGRIALRGLANGAIPAARFSADLGTLSSSASTLPAFTPAAPASRAAVGDDEPWIGMAQVDVEDGQRVGRVL